MYDIDNMYHNYRPHDKEIDRQVPMAEAVIIGSMLGQGKDSLASRGEHEGARTKYIISVSGKRLGIT
jgi:hypothetical protein